MLGVRPSEYAAHVVRLRVAVDGEVAAADGVEVVEADRERGAEPRVHVVAEDRLGVRGDQSLQGHLDPRTVRRAHQNPALGSDELVAQRGVGSLLVEAELFLGPMSAPGSGVEGGAGTEGPPGQICEGSAQDGTLQPGRGLRVLGVQPQVDAGYEGVAVPVEDGPVDVEEPTGRARPGTGGLPQVAAGPAGDLGLGVPLGQVRVPEPVVRHQGRARSEDDRYGVVGGPGLRQPGEEVGEPGPGQRGEVRVVLQYRGAGQGEDVRPGREVLAQVGLFGRDGAGGQRLTDPGGNRLPVHGHRAVDGEDKTRGKSGDRLAVPGAHLCGDAVARFGFIAANFRHDDVSLSVSR